MNIFNYINNLCNWMSKAEKVFSVESIFPLTKKVRLTKHTCFGINIGFYKVMSQQQHVVKTRRKAYGYVL